MDPEELVITVIGVSVITAILSTLKKKKKKKTRRWICRREQGRGVLNMLNSELLLEDPCAYRNYLRLNNEQFQDILDLIESDIKKEDTLLRPSITARSRLEVTLRFLATGETFRSLMYSTRIHESTISRIIPEVCDVIYKRLKSKYLKIPKTEVAWTKIAADFHDLWQFPHCLGALDGKHITFRPPISDGSYYYNYKGQHSIVLLGLVDAHYRFLYVNVGVNGRISDGGVFQSSTLSNAMMTNCLNFPPPKPLPEKSLKVPYVIVADDAFPLLNNLMKPYPQRNLTHKCKIFNYRLSRARRIVENSFGILANRFRVLLNPINLCANKVEKITLACVVLHNYLATENNNLYIDISPNDILRPLQQIGRQGSNMSTNSARLIRNEFSDYFVSPSGSVSWQENAVANNNW